MHHSLLSSCEILSVKKLLKLLKFWISKVQRRSPADLTHTIDAALRNKFKSGLESKIVWKLKKLRSTQHRRYLG
jgi:hypothetical protein